MKTIVATRYVTPLRAGSSLPGLVEADDEGLYVVKFRAAGQGPKALIAELLAGELGRALGLPVPEIALTHVEPGLASEQPEALIRNLVRDSSGLNLGLDYLPGSLPFEPDPDEFDATHASRIVWFDALVTNPDRTRRNTNMLLWHRKLWLIDHGAAIYHHHQLDGFVERAHSPFPLVGDHVLLPFASRLAEVDAAMAGSLGREAIEAIVGHIPDGWLCGDPALPSPAAQRQAYSEYFVQRVQGPRAFVEEAIRAHRALS